MAKKVLVVAPHPDDESIGCGGMIALHRRQGDPVGVVFLTSGERGLPGVPEEKVREIREAEATAACAVIDINYREYLRLPDQGLFEHLERAAQHLAQVLAVHQPDLIYLPHPEDEHPDHHAAAPMVRAALALLPQPPESTELRGYEVWTPMARPEWVEVIDGVMGQKVRAVQCYRSQLALCRYDRAICGLNRYRGVMLAHSEYAEAFQFIESRAQH